LVFSDFRWLAVAFAKAALSRTHFRPLPIPSENFARRGKKFFEIVETVESLSGETRPPTVLRVELRESRGFSVAGHRSASAQRSGATGGAAITHMGSGRSRATDFGRNIEYPEDLTELTK